MFRPDDLIKTARKLASSQNRPTQADLRRAVSTAYYAVFHALAEDCANLLAGSRSKETIRRAWAQVYRNLQHNRVKEAVNSQNSRKKRTFNKFPEPIRDFAELFVVLQTWRHSADYDPLLRNLTKSEVQGMAQLAEEAIAMLRVADKSDRIAFCVFVLHDLKD